MNTTTTMCVLTAWAVLTSAAPSEAQPYPRPQYPTPPADVPIAVTLQALLGGEALIGTSELVRDGDDLIVRVAPANPAADLRRESVASRAVAEIRVHRNASGEVESITRTGDVPGRRAVRVAATASDAERAAVLANARYGARPALLAHLRQRAWGPLGGAASVQEATLAWVASGAGQEAVWVVRLTVPRAGGPVSVVATVDAASGALLALARQGGR